MVSQEGLAEAILKSGSKIRLRASTLGKNLGIEVNASLVREWSREDY